LRGGPSGLSGLQLLEEYMAESVVNVKQKHESQLCMHESMLQVGPSMAEDPSSEDQGEHGRWPSDDVPKPACHHVQLGLEDVSLRIGLLECLGLVDEKSDDVKKPCKPGDYEDDVKCFDVLETHCQNFGLN